MGGKIDEAATGNEIPKVSGPKKEKTLLSCVPETMLWPTVELDRKNVWQAIRLTSNSGASL